MDSSYCLDCKQETDVVFDHRSGDTICTECGLVLEAHAVDATEEYRRFSDQDSDQDPTRVGAASDRLLDNVVFSTNISKDYSKNTNGVCGDINYGFNRSVANLDTNKSLVTAFENLGWMAEKMGIAAAILNDAKGLYKQANEKNFCRGRNFGPITAACLFLACQANGSTRTLKEIAFYAEGSSLKEISRTIERLTKDRVVEVGRKLTKAEDLARRCCSIVGMSHVEEMAVKETLNKLEEVDITRRKPASVLAAVVYMIAQLSSNDKLSTSLEHVSQVAEVKVLTTRKGYKEIYPYASRIIPNWYAKSEDIKKLRIL